MADSENNGDKPNKATVGEPLELPPPSAPPHADVENPSSSSTVVISSINDRWKREDLLMKGNLVLRASAFVFSLISFVVMASNKHGDWMNFDRYEEYRYCLAIAILACLYTGMQVSIKIYHFSTGRDVISTQASGYIGFAGDQGDFYDNSEKSAVLSNDLDLPLVNLTVSRKWEPQRIQTHYPGCVIGSWCNNSLWIILIVAYLLISATSAAASLTNRMRAGSDNLFTDASAASVSMAFFAFAALALSAVISGFKLSHQSYI